MHVSVHIEVRGTHVALDEELILARVSPAQHQQPATRHKPVKLFKPHLLANLLDGSVGGVDAVHATSRALLSAPSSPPLSLLLLARAHAHTGVRQHRRLSALALVQIEPRGSGCVSSKKEHANSSKGGRQGREARRPRGEACAAARAPVIGPWLPRCAQAWRPTPSSAQRALWHWPWR